MLGRRSGRGPLPCWGLPSLWKAKDPAEHGLYVWCERRLANTLGGTETWAMKLGRIFVCEWMAFAGNN